MSKIALVGPVYPFRAGIAHCTTRLAEELRKQFDLRLISFKRQYPKWFYPGGSDIDSTLRDRVPEDAAFVLDVLNPFSWIAVGRRLRRERVETVVFVWWIWVWAIPYLIIGRLAGSRIILQCHNVTDKEPAWWKTALTNAILRRADRILVHASTEAEEVRKRLGERVPVAQSFLPIHEMGGEIPSRSEARRRLGLEDAPVGLFFGHVRPFKGLDIALRAWSELSSHIRLVVAGEIWWNELQRYRRLTAELQLGDRVLFDTRFIPDAEIANYFAAADVVIAPYRREAQSGVALTAFHFGRPVIATAVGGLPELIEHGSNGLLVDPENPKALATAIEQFFTECDRPAMEAAARASAAKYSWEEYGNGLADLIERIMVSS